MVTCLLLFDRLKFDSTTEHPISQMNWLNEFIWWLIKPNSLKKVRDASLQNFFNVFTFILRCGDWSTPMVDEMSLSDGFQVKLIEKDSWCIFTELFQCFHIHIKMWRSIDSHGRWNKFIWWLIKPNSLKKVRDVSLQNLFNVFTFILKCGDRMRIKEDSTRNVNL